MKQEWIHYRNQTWKLAILSGQRLVVINYPSLRIFIKYRIKANSVKMKVYTKEQLDCSFFHMEQEWIHYRNRTWKLAILSDQLLVTTNYPGLIIFVNNFITADDDLTMDVNFFTKKAEWICYWNRILLLHLEKMTKADIVRIFTFIGQWDGTNGTWPRPVGRFGQSPIDRLLSFHFIVN